MCRCTCAASFVIFDSLPYASRLSLQVMSAVANTCHLQHMVGWLQKGLFHAVTFLLSLDSFTI